ncbi:HlyD family type I secretion periplasmic adaptor subunit [Magnetococcales bacterium HHB-1]
MWHLKHRHETSERALIALASRLRKKSHSQKRAISIHHLLFLTLLCAILSFIWWGFHFKLDIFSLSTGEVVPAGHLKRVGHLEGGIVRQIYVRAGMSVKAGQPLFELEKTQIESDVEELKIQHDALTVRKARFEAEMMQQTTVDFPQAVQQRVPQLVAQTKRQFHSRIKHHQQVIKKRQAEVRLRQYEMEEIQARIQLYHQTLPHLEEQIRISHQRFSTKQTDRFQHLNLLKEQADIKNRLHVDKKGLQRAEESVRVAQWKMKEVQSRWQTEASKALEEIELQQRSVEKQLQKSNDRLQRTMIRSPVTGIIKKLHVVTLGGVIKPGGLLAEIVPGEDHLVIEAKLPIQDIGYITQGQSVVMKLMTADAPRYGDLSGRVETISPDTILDEQNIPSYMLHIIPEKEYFQQDNHIYKLYPGMVLQVHLSIGKRNLWAYLLTPFLSQAALALSEK